jgi:hypothetical protein
VTPFLTERMSEIVWTMNVELNVNYINPFVYNVFVFTQEEYGKRSFYERVKPDSFNKAMAKYAL